MSTPIQPVVDDSRLTTGRQATRSAIMWGIVFGAIQAASPLAVRWIEPATVYALSLALIASVYIGFAVADGRSSVIAVEICVAGIFVLLASVAVAASAWLVVIGLAGHGLKDLWQHRHHYVAGTRWWPPFCCAVDLVAAGLIALEILRGLL